MQDRLQISSEIQRKGDGIWMQRRTHLKGEGFN